MCSAMKVKRKEERVGKSEHSLFTKFISWNNHYKLCSCGIAGHHLLMGGGDKIFCFPLLLYVIFAFALLNSLYLDP